MASLFVHILVAAAWRGSGRPRRIVTPPPEDALLSNIFTI
jgi:hypothetical protein